MLKNKKLFVIISFLYSLILSSCTNSGYKVNVEKDRDYSEYQSYRLNSLLDFYNIDEEYYAIYLTSTSCPHCQEIKNHLLSYYDLDQIPFTLLYFDMKARGTEEGDLNRSFFMPPNEYSTIYNIDTMLKNNVSDLKDTYFCGTPSIYVVKNSSLNECYVGKNEVLTFIDSFIK